jgi:hypothetical protein
VSTDPSADPDLPFDQPEPTPPAPSVAAGLAAIAAAVAALEIFATIKVGRNPRGQNPPGHPTPRAWIKPRSWSTTNPWSDPTGEIWARCLRYEVEITIREEEADLDTLAGQVAETLDGLQIPGFLHDLSICDECKYLDAPTPEAKILLQGSIAYLL